MDIFDLGERIRDARRARKMTQEDLASKAGITRSWLGKIETGQVFDIKFNTVMSVLDVLGLDMRVTTANAGRPTLDDLQQEQKDDYPSMG